MKKEAGYLRREIRPPTGLTRGFIAKSEVRSIRSDSNGGSQTSRAPYHRRERDWQELAARAIHENSARAQAPFITINCGRSRDSFGVELFGYMKGARRRETFRLFRQLAALCLGETAT
jgi:hypothetical protein